MSLKIVSEIFSSDLDESQESIFWCKKSGFPPFGGRLASLCKMEEMPNFFLMKNKALPLNC